MITNPILRQSDAKPTLHEKRRFGTRFRETVITNPILTQNGRKRTKKRSFSHYTRERVICCSSVGTTRTIYSSWCRGSLALLVRRRLVRPIRARKSLWECGQGMVASAVGLLALFFLVCLRSSATAVWLVSHALVHLWTAERHAALSWADFFYFLFFLLCVKVHQLH